MSRYSHRGRERNECWPESTGCVLFWHLQYVLEPAQYRLIWCLLCLPGADKNNLLTKQNTKWLNTGWFCCLFLAMIAAWAVGMASQSAIQLVQHFDADRNTSTAFYHNIWYRHWRFPEWFMVLNGWMDCLEICCRHSGHVPFSMNFNNFGDPLTVHLVPLSGKNFSTLHILVA